MKPLHYAQQIAYSSKDVLMFTYEMAKRFAQMPGWYCECGCAAGAQVIALACGAPNKKVYAFDSFCGLPLPSNRDDQMPGIRKLDPLERVSLPDPGKQKLQTTGAVSVSQKDFGDHMLASGIDVWQIIPVVGWFEETVPRFVKDWKDMYMEFSILRLDGDLYNSTWVCLQHLFPKVIQGGCVIVDDWTLQGCQDACREYFELIGYEPDYKFLDGTAYFYK